MGFSYGLLRPGAGFLKQGSYGGILGGCVDPLRHCDMILQDKDLSG